MPQWKITLDAPYNFAVENGFIRAVHCADFRPTVGPYQNADADFNLTNGVFNDTWRCPVTDVVMLNPSFNRADWYKNLVEPRDLTFSADFWKQVKSGDGHFKSLGSTGGTAPPPNMLTSLKPAPKTFALIEILVEAAIIAIGNAALFEQNYDGLKWAIKTDFSLGVDEGFAVHYYGLAAEDIRRDNWFAVQWDDIYVHFSHQGKVRVFQYRDRHNLKHGGFDQVQEFEIGNPGDFLNREGYFVFLPMPGIGLALYHYAGSASGNLVQANAGAASFHKGQLIQWKTRQVGEHDRLFESTPVNFAVNPYHHHKMGMQRLTFPQNGDYVDATFDIGYGPTLPADDVRALMLNTPQQIIAATLWKPDLSAVWEGGDTQARVKLGLSSQDERYTPFARGYGVRWQPVYATRDTTPLVLSNVTKTMDPDAPDDWQPSNPDRVLHLEFTQDEYARFEGHCRALLSSAAAMAIAERGDATFTLEISEDEGATWEFVEGGFAKHFDLTIHCDTFGTYYDAEFSLLGMNERFHETHLFNSSAFDGLTIGEAMNATLTTAGFPALDTATMPPEANKLLPPATGGQTWKLAPREDEDGEKVLSQLTFMLSTSGKEWRTRFNWPAATWFLEAKPHPTADEETWTLSPFSGDKNTDSRVWWYGDGAKRSPEPPECNNVSIEGMDTPGQHGVKLLTEPLLNSDSLYDPTSPDYLGRSVVGMYKMQSISDQKTLDGIARTIFDASCHRRDKLTLTSRLQWAMQPCVRVVLWRGDRTPLVTGWIKKRHVMVEHEDIEEMTLDIDSIWEGDMKQ